MVLVKQSFRHKTISVKKTTLGTEFGAIIKNNPAVYPKTGQWKYERPIVSEKCIGCGVCIANCPEAVMDHKKLPNGKKRAYADNTFCKGCGICAAVCPVKAIEMKA